AHESGTAGDRGAFPEDGQSTYGIGRARAASGAASGVQRDFRGRGKARPLFAARKARLPLGVGANTAGARNKPETHIFRGISWSRRAAHSPTRVTPSR